MKSVLLVMVLLGGLVMGVGCTKSVSFDTVEDARRQVRENSTMIAQIFRSENKLAEYEIYARGDSTQSAECPQGDGWASIDLTDRKANLLIKLKCSTVSLGIGCMTDADFKSKRYAQEEGRCNREIPFPLPKIAK